MPGLKCASGEERHWTRRAYRRGKKCQLEQVLNLLRQIEVAAANGKTTAQACKEAWIVEQTYFRWRVRSMAVCMSTRRSNRMASALITGLEKR